MTNFKKMASHKTV